MTKPKEMLLADALETAINTEKENIKLKRWLIWSLVLNVALSLITLLISL